MADLSYGADPFTGGDLTTGRENIAIGALMRGYANYKSRGGEIKLCGLGKRLKDLFTMTKLIMVFDHHETEDQAVAAFAV